MRIYDVSCNNCNGEGEQFLGDKKEFEPCPQCGEEVRRIFTKFTFELKYDPKKDRVGGAANNYNESQYWKEFRKQRYNQKKDVIPYGAEPDPKNL